MRRWLYAYDTVAGAPDRLDRTLRREIVRLLQEATGGSLDLARGADGSFELHLPSPTGAIPGSKRVRAATGVAAKTADGRTRVPLRWAAEGARHFFPVFDGMLELQPLSERFAQLSIVGAYDVPLGPVGLAADATVLAGAARRTAADLVAALARALGAAERSPQSPAAPPATPLGRPLAVRDVMTPHPLQLDEDLPLRTAALLLFHYEVSGAPVVAADGSLVGVLSERDLLDKEASPHPGLGRQAADSERRRVATTVGQACSRPAVTTAPDAPLREVARAMADQEVGRVVVVDDSAVAGVLSRHDVLAALLRTDAEVQAAVDVVLSGFPDSAVVATVEWGAVRLRGEVARRSQVPRIRAALESLDGVFDIDGDVSWREDDVLPPTAIGLSMGG